MTKKIRFHVLIILILSLLVEAIVFNYKSFIPRGERITYVASECRMSGFVDNGDGTYLVSSVSPSISITNINAKTKSVYIDIERVSSTASKTSATVYYTDTTKPVLTNSNSQIQIIEDYEKSKYAELDFFGETGTFRICFTDLKSGETVRFNKIEFNAPIPFQLSGFRYAVFTSIVLLIYAFVMLFYYRKEVASNKKLIIGTKITLVALATIVLLYFFGGVYGLFQCSVFTNSGSQISQELVDMFKAGRVSLLAEPSDELKALQNPYNPSLRSGVSYLWDHLYYNGKYYSYYGVTPVFILFLPANLITGMYLSDIYGVLLFSIIGLVFMSISYFMLCKRYFKKLPLYAVSAGYIILFAACGVLTNISRPEFYEVSTSCAYMCMMIFLFFFTKSSVLFKNEKIRPVMLLFASLFAGMAVLSRPTTALYAGVFAVWTLVRIIMSWKNSSVKGRIGEILCFLLPIGTLACFQLVYNYLRFGSFLEFGIRYSLTINDFTNTEFRLNQALNSIWNFLFAIPTYSQDNFFVHSNPQYFSTGYYFSESYNAIGLFYRVPLIFTFVLLPFTERKRPIKEKLLWILKYFVPLFIIPFALVALTWESGFAIRYYSDFAWAMILLGLFSLFYYIEKLEEQDNAVALKIVATMLCAHMLFTTGTSFAHVLGYIPFEGKWTGYNGGWENKRYYKLARQLSFWR